CPEQVDDYRPCAGPRYVEGARDLCRRPRVVDPQSVAFLAQPCVDPGGRLAQAVVVHEALGLGLHIRELAQGGARRRLHVIEGLSESAANRVGTEPLDGLLEPPTTE